MLTVEAASGFKKLPVSWKVVAKDPTLFLPFDALPEGLVFQNPMRMTANNVTQLWKHILELQTAEDSHDRFRWTHWWKRAGHGEDSGQRHPADYGRPPRPKQSKTKGSAHQANRIKIVRMPPKGAFGLHKPSTNGDEEGDEDDDSNKHMVGRHGQKKNAKKDKKKSNEKDAQKEKGKSNGKAKKRSAGMRKGKGKAKARRADDSEESAVSSDVSSEGGDIELGSDNSGPTESVDMNASGSGGEDFFALDDLVPLDDYDDITLDTYKPGPSKLKGPPKPRPVRKAADPPTRPSVHSSDRPSEATPEPEPGRAIAGPWDDAPVGMSGLSSVRVPPTKTAIQAATGKPPSWVETDPERILPFLWSLNAEADYRNFLKSWRHMVSHM